MTETERLQKELAKTRSALDKLNVDIDAGLLVPRIDAIIALESLREAIADLVERAGHPALADEIRYVPVSIL